jgi:uncharacterized YigZ family protein
MDEILTYRSLERLTEAEFKDRGSRFLAFADHVNDAADIKSKLKSLKELHPKAVHHCYAYRLGLNKNEFRANDDGEPAGSAGKPILGQIDRLELTHTLVVVVRYFGGTLLGVPGLINAYKTSAQMALSANSIITYDVCVSYHLSFDYNLTNQVMRMVKLTQAKILFQELNLFCEMKISLPVKEVSRFEALSADLHTLKIQAVED